MAGGREILLVDDEAALRELMKVALGGDYDYLEAADADAAVELARERKPAVVLLDVMLPGGSGLDVLREIRDDPGLRDVRVVVVSAWQSLEDREAAVELGADGFLAKPFQLEELVNVVTALVDEAA